MRRMCRVCKAVAVIVSCALCAAFGCALLRAPVFEGGERYEFYLGASSSQTIVPSQTPARDKLLLSGLSGVAGESARYEGDCAAEIAARFGAKLQFTEEACGVVNYYMYAPALGGGVRLNGKTVNLHIAVGNGQTAAGTPLIFGGF